MQGQPARKSDARRTVQQRAHRVAGILRAEVGRPGTPHFDWRAFFCDSRPPAGRYTLSLHDALPISRCATASRGRTTAPSRRAPRRGTRWATRSIRSEEHTSELQSRRDLVCRLLLEKKKPCRASPPGKAMPVVLSSSVLTVWPASCGLKWAVLARHILIGVRFSVTAGRPPAATLFPYTTLFRSLDALRLPGAELLHRLGVRLVGARAGRRVRSDRKSTRLNSSHVEISYAVFCLKKKNHAGPARPEKRCPSYCPAACSPCGRHPAG